MDAGSSPPRETVKTLKAKLKSVGLPISGKKEVLQDRLKAWKGNNCQTALLNAVSVSTSNNFSSLPSNTLPPLPSNTFPPLPSNTLHPLPSNTFPPLPSNTLPPLPTVRHRATESKETLKDKLKVLGAKHVGRKNVLQERLKLWSDNNLNRTLFNVETVAALDASSFPITKHDPLEKLHPTDPLYWLTEEAINLYFNDRMARKGNQKGRRLFMRNFLKDCKFLKQGDDIYFRALCCAEMKKTVEYEVKLHVNCMQCEIMKATCGCPAGKGCSAACKHVSALLYTIEYYAVTGLVKQNVTCTSTPQQWHQPYQSGRNLPKTDINQMMNIVTPTILESVPLTNFVFNKFSQAKCASVFARRRNCNMTAYLQDHQYCSESLDRIILNRINTVTLSDIRKTEKKTRKNHKLWLQQRRTRITASIAHDVIRTCRSKRYCTKFLVNHFSNKPIRTKAIKWGLTHEATALKKYCSVMGADGQFSKCGLMIDQTLNYLAATPDAVDTKKETIVEIKCPHSAKDKKPEAVQYLSSGQLKSTHRYYTQIQMQMHVSKIHQCDFVVWTPQGIFIQGIKYDAELVSSYLIDCEFYYKNVFSKVYFKTIYSAN